MIKEKEEKGSGRRDDEDKKKTPIGGIGGSVDLPVCELCGEYHQPVFQLRKEDEGLVEHFVPLCTGYSMPALFTLCTLSGKTRKEDRRAIEVGEHAIRFMLTQGAKWVLTDQNQRAGGSSSSSSSSATTTTTTTAATASSSSSSSKSGKSGERKKEITEMPATSIAMIRSAPALKLSVEPLMLKFQEFLCGDHPRFAGIRALFDISYGNLRNLREKANFEAWKGVDGHRTWELFQLLRGFNLSLTHYADAPRGRRPPSKESKKPKSSSKKEEVEDENQACILSLYSRIFLDSHHDELGIQGYPEGNTPSMAFKNVGHVDFVFFAIEPRVGSPLTRPYKVGSRFGRFCHLIDFDQLPYCSILTLGDLDTCNAKIGVKRLANGSDVKTAQSLGFCQENVDLLKKVCTQRDTNPTETRKAETIWARDFASRSEQMFIRDHIKEALALKVILDCQTYGFLHAGFCEANPAAADYNCLINGLFVPQVMIPRAFCTEQALMFEGEMTPEEIEKEKQDKQRKIQEKLNKKH